MDVRGREVVDENGARGRLQRALSEGMLALPPSPPARPTHPRRRPRTPLLPGSVPVCIRAACSGTFREPRARVLAAVSSETGMLCLSLSLSLSLILSLVRSGRVDAGRDG